MSDPDHLVNRFGAWDYTVFGGMLAVSAFIGIYYACSGGKQKTTSEFLMGNKSLGVFPVSMSVLASFMSAITLLGTPAEMYLFNTMYFMVCLSYFAVIPIAAYLFLPVFYELNLTSTYEYFEKRFNRTVRSIGSFIFAVQMLIYMAIVLYAPALALSQVTGINLWMSVLSIGIVCTFYTSIGGIKAVVWTDLFQVLMMYGAMVVIVIKGAVDVGGFPKVWRLGLEGQRIQFFNFSVDPTVRHTVWGVFFGGCGLMMSVYGVNQAMIQRYLSIGTLKGARSAIWINLPALILLQALTGLAGLVIYAKYYDCDPILTKTVGASDQLLPLFVMDTLGMIPGLPGLFVAGVFSGALSTVSSGVNSLAAVTLEDFIKVYIKKDISESKATFLTKIIATAFGVLCIILVFLAEQLGNVLQAAITMFSITGGPLLGLFTLGIFFPWANSLGSVIGLVLSLICSFWISFGSMAYHPYIPKSPVSVEGCIDLYLNATGQVNYTAPLRPDPLVVNAHIPSIYRISYIWYVVIATVLSIVIGAIASLLTGPTKIETIDKRLLSPHIVYLYPWLKKTWNQDPEKNGAKKDKSESSLAKSSNGVINDAYRSSSADIASPKFIQSTTSL